MTNKITCPKCSSDQITANKQGFSGKKAVGGALLTGGIGLLAGTIGSNKVKVTCLACGETWLPGEYAEKKQQAASQKETAEMGFWKKEFYRRYELGDMKSAEEYYKLNKALSSRITDFHQGYKHLKKGDGQTAAILWVFLIIIAVVVYLIVT